MLWYYNQYYKLRHSSTTASLMYVQCTQQQLWYAIQRICIIFCIFITSHSEGFSASTFSFRVWIFKCELTGEFGFFPIHDGSYHTKECHGLNVYIDSVRLYFYILFRFLKRIIQGIRKTVASSSFHSQPNTECSLCGVPLQNCLYPVRCSFRLT